MSRINELNSATTALVFPGQGSQKVGMGRDLFEGFAVARHVFERADEVLGFRLSDLMWNGPADALNETDNTQPALFVHSLAAHAVLQDKAPAFRPALLAGHSLGEISALTAGGALDFDVALRLVRHRGELMKRAGAARPGMMAAILNLDIPMLEQVCATASVGDETVQVANDNCPGQVVISGSKAAVERAMEAAKAAGARSAIPLAVSIAAHSGLMESIQADWDAAVRDAGLTDSALPVIGNVGADILTKGADLAEDIRRQMQSRVRWTESIQKAATQGVNTYIEVGSGMVLLGLIKRISPDAARIPMGTAADTSELL